MKRKILIAVIDAGSTDYLNASDIPNIRQMIKNGFMAEVSSVMPSVTNVNNVSILTGTFPAEHGITANYWYNPDTGTGTYMEAPEFLEAENLFEKASAMGLESALFTSKNKLRLMLQRGASLSVSAENPDKELIEKTGPKEEIYSAAINHWLFRAMHQTLREKSYDITYISTTDYIMHKFPPEHEKAIEHLNEIDRILGMVLNDNPDMEVYITADHGMNSKEKALNLEIFLARHGIKSIFIPVIKDKYVVHHDNLGGIAYLYLVPESGSSIEKTRQEASGILKTAPGVEEIYTREEAARLFRLKPERIGDLVVLAEKKTVFSLYDREIKDISIRSHGSRYESSVPVIGFNSPVRPENLKSTPDIVKNLLLTL